MPKQPKIAEILAWRGYELQPESFSPSSVPGFLRLQSSCQGCEAQGKPAAVITSLLPPKVLSSSSCHAAGGVPGSLQLLSATGQS